MSARQAAPVAENFDLPELPPGNPNGPQDAGTYDGEIVEVKPPKPSNMTNDQGNKPLTSIFVWRLDDYPEYDQWAYVNVEARGERSTLYKLCMALWGQKIDKTTKLKSTQFLGSRARLILDKKDDGYMKVTGYFPIPAKRAVPPRVVAPVASPVQLFAEAIEDLENGDAPF